MTKRELIIKRNQSILLKGQTLKLLQHSFVWAGVGGWVGGLRSIICLFTFRGGFWKQTPAKSEGWLNFVTNQSKATI